MGNRRQRRHASRRAAPSKTRRTAPGSPPAARRRERHARVIIAVIALTFALLISLALYRVFVEGPVDIEEPAGTDVSLMWITEGGSPAL